MADRIKGITIEIGGDTTGLSKALSGVNKEISGTQSQLKDVERLLKLDPSNTELLRQKQKLLADAVSETKDKLETLKSAEKQAQDQFKEGKISEEQYDALKREIIDTEQKLKSLEDQAGKSNVTLQQISAVGDKFQEVGQKIEGVGKKLLPISAAVGGIGVAAVKTTADFDSSMSNVSAISGTTGEDFDRLRDKAREMGAETKFSASEAADAMSYMAMAGWKTEDMLNGISGIMDLAAASGADLATTSDIVTDALTGMGYTAADAGRLADVMAAASSNANTNVEMMGETFKYVAPVCGSLGYSMEDTALAVGLMANSGIKASQAGTQLRGALTNMVKPTEAMEGVMNELGIEIANEDGSMKSLDETLKILRDSFAVTTEEQKAQRLATLEQQAVADGYGDSLKGLTEEEKYFQLAMYAGQEQVKDMSEAQFKKQAMDKLGVKVTKKTNKAQVAQNLALALGTQSLEGLTQEQQSAYAATLFGKEAMSGMLAIINASEEDYNKLSDAIANSNGVAKSMSETMQDNLNGQLTILKSQLQEAAIAIGDALIPKIRALVSKIQEWTDWFNQLDESQKEMVVTVGLIAAAIGPLLITIGKLSTGIGALLKIIPAISGALAALSASGGPLFLTALAISGVASAFIIAKDNANSYEKKAWELSDAEKENAERIYAMRDAYDELSQRRQDAVLDIDSQTQYESDLWEELQRITDENGKVLKGNEDRAAFIVTTLNEALGTEIELNGDVIEGYKGIQSEIDNLIEKQRAEAIWKAYQEEFSEAVKNREIAQSELTEAVQHSQDATEDYNSALAEEKRLQAEYNSLMEEYAKDGTNDTLRQQLYDLQDQLIASGEATEGFGELMDRNNQTVEDAQEELDRYNVLIKNYEGVSSAIISGDQEKISDSLLLLQHDFRTTENATKESLQAQHETIKTELANAKQALADGSANFSSEYISNLEKLEKKAEVELAVLTIISGISASNAAKAVSEKAGEMENAGGDIAGAAAKGVEGGTKDVVDSATDLAKDTIGGFKKEYKISSGTSKVTEEVGEKGVDGGLKGGIEKGSENVVGAVTEVSAEMVSTAETGLSTEVFFGIGQQIPAGLSGGVMAGKARALTSIQQLCTEVVNTARNRLGIHSPSTEFAYIGQMSGEGFVEGWDSTLTSINDAVTSSVGQAVTKAAETFSGIETALLSLRDSSGDAIGEVVQNAQEAQKALQEIQDKLGDTISGQMDLFSAFDGQAKTTTDELLSNMQSQVDGTEQWAENLRILAERGVDQGLLQKMAEMGPKGAGYVSTFTQMTDDELQRANALFAQSMTLPESTAASIMQSYQVAGTMTAQGFNDGMQENMGASEETARQMADDAITAIRTLLEIHSPSEVTKEAGQYFTQGFADGITLEIGQVQESVTQVTEAATSTLETQLQQSDTTTQTYQTSMGTSWSTWAANLVTTINTSLADIGLGASTQLGTIKSSFAAETDAINTDWATKWTAIETKHKTTLQDIKTLTSTVLQAIKALNRTETETMKTDTITAMNQMVAGVDAELKNLEPTVKAGFDPAVKHITDLIPQATTWSHDMMDNFIQGIRDKMEELEDACRDVADTVSDYMHFTRPEKGPLRYYEEWMPHMMQGLAKGIRDNRNLITDQMKILAGDMAAIQGVAGNGDRPVINFSNRTVVELEGRQIGQVVDEYLGGVYG